MLRVPILYGDVEYLAESAVTVLFDKVRATDLPCVMSAYERRYPTACRDVASVVRQLTECRLKVLRCAVNHSVNYLPRGD